MSTMAGHELNEEQEDYLETIAILVDQYDRTQPEKSTPLAVLRLLMEEHDLSGRDLGRILGDGNGTLVRSLPSL